MEGKMKVAVMNGIGKMGFTERDIPTPKDDEVLVKLDYVGICGSDLHYYESGAIGDYVVEPPFVLGHEPGGVVVEVGKAQRLHPPLRKAYKMTTYNHGLLPHPEIQDHLEVPNE